MLPCEQQPPGGRIELESKSPHDSSENSEKPQISGIDNQRITATYSGGLTPSADGVSPRISHLLDIALQLTADS